MAEAEDRSPRSRTRGLMVAVAAWKKFENKKKFKIYFIRKKKIENCEFGYWVSEKKLFWAITRFFEQAQKCLSQFV